MSLTFVRVMRRIFGERVEHLILQQRTVVLIVALVVFSSLVTGCLGDVDKPDQTIVTISGTVRDAKQRQCSNILYHRMGRCCWC